MNKKQRKKRIVNPFGSVNGVHVLNGEVVGGRTNSTTQREPVSQGKG